MFILIADFQLLFHQPDFRCIHINRIISELVVLAKHVNILNKLIINLTIHVILRSVVEVTTLEGEDNH